MISYRYHRSICQCACSLIIHLSRPMKPYLLKPLVHTICGWMRMFVRTWKSSYVVTPPLGSPRWLSDFFLMLGFSCGMLPQKGLWVYGMLVGVWKLRYICLIPIWSHSGTHCAPHMYLCIYHVFFAEGESVLRDAESQSVSMMNWGGLQTLKSMTLSRERQEFLCYYLRAQGSMDPMDIFRLPQCLVGWSHSHPWKIHHKAKVMLTDHASYEWKTIFAIELHWIALCIPSHVPPTRRKNTIRDRSPPLP